MPNKELAEVDQMLDKLSVLKAKVFKTEAISSRKMKQYRRFFICRNPHAILVGYSGRIRHDNRLAPIRITRKYKDFLKQEEVIRSEKIWEMSKLIKKIENLVSIINSVMKENKDNLNSSLLLELEQQKTTCKKQLLHLKSQLDWLPDTLNDSIQNIFNRQSKCQRSNKTWRLMRRKKNEVRFSEITCVNHKNVPTRPCCRQSRSKLLPERPARSANNVSSRFACVKSQIFVRNSNLELQTVNIDLFSNGENLLHVLAGEHGFEVRNRNVMFGTKQVETNKTLWEQGIFHGTVIDLIGQLHGGMERKKEKNKKSGSAVTSVVVHGNEMNRARVKQEIQKGPFERTSDVIPNREDIATKDSVTSQVLVRGNSKLRVVNINMFENGETLQRHLQTEFGKEMKNYNVLFGSKKLDKKSSLREQGVTHGSTLDIFIGLDGGMEREATQVKDSPIKWKKLEVGKWIDRICDEYEIEEDDVSDLKTLNGRGLDRLDKEDWIRRSPKQGDLFYKLWIDLKVEKPTEVLSSEVKIVAPEEKLLMTPPPEEKSSVAEVSNHGVSENANTEVEAESSLGQIQGRFGVVDSVKDLDGVIPLQKLPNDAASASPAENSVIFISGICCEKPEVRGTTCVMFLRDDPDGASSAFHELKVVVQARKINEDLNAKAVGKLCKKIQSGTPVAVKGRVEKLDHNSEKREKKGYVTLGFKLLVDSDKHVFLIEISASSEQSSQPWYVQGSIYPAEIDGKKLHAGDSLQKTTRRIFCKSSASHDEIKKIAVAFKNSFDGDIFVGVEEKRPDGIGVVTGMEFTQREVITWREKIAQEIGKIIPGNDEPISFCENDAEARRKIGKECFISAMKLNDAKEAEKVHVMAWIHVPKGTAPVHFAKPKDIHAFVRVGAETKRMSDYKELFSCLESLSSRKIKPISEKEVQQQYEMAMKKMTSLDPYKLFKTKRPESHDHEFKMIFSDKPVKKIKEEYLAEYICGFLNSHAGTIYFGVQEDEESKAGHVIGVVIPQKEKEELVQEFFNVLREFYPPVDPSQVSVTFRAVSVSVDVVFRYPKACVERSGKCVLLQGPPDEIGKKWPKFIKDKLPNMLCRVIRVKAKCFCIVTAKPYTNQDQLFEIVEKFVKNNPKLSMGALKVDELTDILKDLCVVEVVVNRSLYPIHMAKPLETFFVNNHGEHSHISPEHLVRRFEVQSKYENFDIQKFLSDVDRFDTSGNSFIMISSPFNLPKLQQDLYGLVIPKWTLAIDFDQDPKAEGHFFHIFEKLHDRYQKERDRFLVTPQDECLDLSADHGICWLAARGHRDIATSLSDENHGKTNWNISHRKNIQSLLNTELTRNVKPNKLHIVVLWDEGHHKLLYSLHLLLADILSISEDISVTFVCSTAAAHSDIKSGTVKQLRENYSNVVSDSVHVAPLHILAKFLACKLPQTFRPEDDYQVPHKTYHQNGSSAILPVTLPQRLRQNIQGRLEVMYMNKSGRLDDNSLKQERQKFFSGSQISPLGLQGNIGIEREKMVDLMHAFKTLSNDKKSRVSLIVVKADRGAGTTTMCLQFLFKKSEKYPCAQLIEIHRDLLSSIESINQITNLPVLLLVDEEVANLQDFLEFKKQAEGRRSVNIIFLMVEPVQIVDKTASKKILTSSVKGKRSRYRTLGDSSLYGSSSYQEIQLKSVLQPSEVEKLSNELKKMCPDEKIKANLQDLKERAMCENGRCLRNFAHFSLTVFGREFTGLEDYVKFRLELANDLQKDVLAFLSLTHVFTDYALPLGAFTRLLKKDNVVVKSMFQDARIHELLSPPAHETDSRRISFLEVADEILKQLSETTEIETIGDDEGSEDKYWFFIKHVSVKLAKEVLSVNIGAVKIDRLTRKLFVISEYETEKFSSLIRNMKINNRDIARNTLLELVEIFKKHDSFGAHLLAHLAKYYMIEYKDFRQAKPRIEEAVRILPDDALLHHIHGDIIRHHVDALKNEEQVVMNDIVMYASESSGYFQTVRRKRPHMSHGYASDAMVRITVMQAAIKVMGGGQEKSFVDYLIQMIEKRKNEGGRLKQHERYLLALIIEAYEYLNESSIDFEYKDSLIGRFLKCIPEVTALKTLCEKLDTEKKSFGDQQGWIEEIIIQTNSLLLVLEIELTKDISPDELERRIKTIEECGSRSKLDERSMKYWFRYARYLRSPPSLKDVTRRVKQWIDRAKKMGGMSPHADFYNYVVHLLAALKDPKDVQKMEKAAQLVQQRQHFKSRKELSKFPHVEWLCPKQARHVNSIDSLLHNDDLLKDDSQPYPGSQRRNLPWREVVESALRRKNVARWEGVVKRIKHDWHGTISFYEYIDVHFVPQNVRPCRPAIGDTVNFYLSFDWHGPSAWSVMRNCDTGQSSSIHNPTRQYSSNSSGSEGEMESQVVVATPLHCLDIQDQERFEGQDFHTKASNGNPEMQRADSTRQSEEKDFLIRVDGSIKRFFTDSAYGFICPGGFVGDVFFHQSDLVDTEYYPKPGDSVSFYLTETAKGYVAKNISQASNGNPEMQRADSKRQSGEKGCLTRVGSIKRFLPDRAYGFIRCDGFVKDIFFHQNDLVDAENWDPKPGDSVSFYLTANNEGYAAKNILQVLPFP